MRTVFKVPFGALYLIPLKLVMKRVLDFYRLPVLDVIKRMDGGCSVVL